MVPKLDETIWFCINYHKLNTVSKFDAYPMPWVNKLLQQLEKAKCITTLDLAKGRIREANSLHNTLGAILVPNSPLWAPWCPHYLPAANGQGTAATSRACCNMHQ